MTIHYSDLTKLGTFNRPERNINFQLLHLWLFRRLKNYFSYSDSESLLRRRRGQYQFQTLSPSFHLALLEAASECNWRLQVQNQWQGSLGYIPAQLWVFGRFRVKQKYRAFPNWLLSLLAVVTTCLCYQDGQVNLKSEKFISRTKFDLLLKRLCPANHHPSYQRPTINVYCVWAIWPSNSSSKVKDHYHLKIWTILQVLTFHCSGVNVCWMDIKAVPPAPGFCNQFQFQYKTCVLFGSFSISFEYSFLQSNFIQVLNILSFKITLFKLNSSCKLSPLA